MKNSKKEYWRKRLSKTNDYLALGYEATLDFNHGYLYSLKANNAITKREFNELVKEFATDPYYSDSD